MVITADHFDPFEIMESGQCFRMVPAGPDAVETIAFGRRVTVTALGDNRFALDCSEADFIRFWRGYFDLDTDYDAILNAAPKDDVFLSQAIIAADGLRILRQDPWETLCCFILSQRKNIKAIRACVEAICNAFGEPVAGTDRKTFPAPEALACTPESRICLCGTGYRAPYLTDAARKVVSGQLNLTALAALPDDALFSALTTIHGVGTKVADCVMLFGFRRLSRAPVDVWIRRVIDEEYGGVSPFEEYGEYAGIYQQYMFILKKNAGKPALKA